MYFWNINKLKQQLIETGLTEKQLLYYILIHAFPSGSISSESESDLWVYAASITAVLIFLIGTILAFRANGGNSGIKFAERYFSISFVVSIRLLPLLISLGMLVAVYLGFTYKLNDNKWSDAPDFIWGIIIFIYCIAVYARIIKHIGDVAKAKPNSDL